MVVDVAEVVLVLCVTVFRIPTRSRFIWKISWSWFSSAFRKIASSSSSMRSSNSARLGKKLSTRPPTNAVQQERWVVDRSLALPVAPADLCKGRTVVAMNGDKEPFGVEAMHLDQPVVVGAGAVDDDKDEVVIAIDFRSLVELLRVFERKRMELEDLAQDVEVASRR